MAINAPSEPPDYELLDSLALTTPAQVRALGDGLRTTILGLLHERAATVTELAAAVERPKSTVAHHVNVLAEAGLVRVVRTRKVRAIDERYFGRTARMFYVGVGQDGRPAEDMPLDFNDLEVAAKEASTAYHNHELWSFIRHARITRATAGEFWQRMTDLVQEFDRTPRAGDKVYGFVVGIYPTDHPTLPDPSD
jgi:DNA-binding transcriptional ArsR family regulator